MTNTKIVRKTVEQFKMHVNVTHRDIYEGECFNPSLCMEKVAVERALRDIDPKGGDHKVRVDAAKIRFNLGGYKYLADTPKIAKRALIQFDSEAKEKKKADRTGVEFHSRVKPHGYNLISVKGAKIKPMGPRTAARLAQIRAARLKRKEKGAADHDVYARFRNRVAGTAVSV